MNSGSLSSYIRLWHNNLEAALCGSLTWLILCGRMACDALVVDCTYLFHAPLAI